MPPRASKDPFGEFRTNSAARVQAPKRLDIRDRDLGSRQGRALKEMQKLEQSYHTKPYSDLEELDSISNDPRVLDLLSNMDQDVFVASEDNESNGQEEPKFLSHYRISALNNYIERRDQFLRELIQLEGRQSQKLCGLCRIAINGTVYRCRECFGNSLRCSKCIVTEHARNPFHHIEAWNERYFSRATLGSVGLELYLLHDGGTCPNARKYGRGVINIIHSNGFHFFKVFFCGCANAPVPWIQLLRSRLWPASFEEPRTAFTLDVLDQFQRLNFNGKITLYAYYETLYSLTDNTGVKKYKSKLEEFGFAVRFYRHYKLLKRFGRAHAEDGVLGTTQGSLALACPACPQPGINLPIGWENEPQSSAWLYSLFLSLDGNFRVKLKDRKLPDIPLTRNLAYYVDEERYLDYVKLHKGEDYINFCSSKLRAVDHANSKNRLFKYMGIFGSKCARHLFMRPNGCGDLPRGEAHACVDYIAFSSIGKVPIKVVVFCYDIACCWIVNLDDRRVAFPKELSLHPTMTTLRVAIPDFHLVGHGDSCQSVYGLLRTPEVGRDASEGIETTWAPTNKLGPSAQEMSRDARRELLDDHFGFSNWEKTKRLGIHLLKKFNAAVTNRDTQMSIYNLFTESHSSSTISEWQSRVSAWEHARQLWQVGGHRSKQYPPASLDPYQYKDTSMSMREAEERLEKLEQEARGTRLLEKGFEVMSSTRWLTTGLRLEGQQRELMAYDRSTKDSTIAHRRKDLLSSISSWIALQDVYLEPSVRLTETSKAPEEPPAEKISLLLPSNVVASRPDAYSKEIQQQELELRVAQAGDALGSIRHNLGLRRYLLRYKQEQVHGTGQGALTRTRAMIAQYSRTIDLYANTYRAARKAILSLDPNHQCLLTFLNLDAADVQYPSANLEERDLLELEQEVSSDPTHFPVIPSISSPSKSGRPSKSREKISWIWTMGRRSLEMLRKSTDASANEDWLNQDLQVEWARSQSRAYRWREEVRLLAEEMRRTIRYCEWKSSWWLSRLQSQSSTTLKSLQIGRNAYAHRQSDMWLGLALKFSEVWTTPLREQSTDWAENIRVVVKTGESEILASDPLLEVANLAQEEFESSIEMDVDS